VNVGEKTPTSAKNANQRIVGVANAWLWGSRYKRKLTKINTING